MIRRLLISLEVGDAGPDECGDCPCKIEVDGLEPYCDNPAFTFDVTIARTTVPGGKRLDACTRAEEEAREKP